MSHQPPAVTDGEMARMYQVVAEERAKTIRALEQSTTFEQARASRQAERHEQVADRLLDHNRRLERSIWILADVLLLETIVLVLFLLWLYFGK